MFQKVVGILLLNKRLGSTWNKMDCGMHTRWWVLQFRFNWSFNVLIFSLVNQNVSQSMSKKKQVQGSLYSFFGGKHYYQMIEKLTQHLKHLLWPKKHASSRRLGRINSNGWGLTWRKTKWSEFPKNMQYSLRIWTKKFEMIRVIRSFADGLVNFNPTGPAEDQTQKLISSTDNNLEIRIAGSSCHPQLTYQFILRIKNYVILQTVNFSL